MAIVNPAFDQFDDLILDASQRYGVPFLWVKAFIGTESSFRPEAIREEEAINDASRGLMQVLGRTARALGYEGSLDGLFDPAINIDLGTKLMAEIIGREGPDFRRVYSAYNSGGGGNYLTNPVVARNVARAEAWLNRLASGGGLTLDSSAMPMLLFGGFAILLLSKGNK